MLVTEKLFGKFVKQKPEFCKIRLHQHCIINCWLNEMNSRVLLSGFKKQMLRCRCAEVVQRTIVLASSWHAI